MFKHSYFRFCFNNGEECKADIQQEAVGVPIPGDAQGQARWDSRQPDLVGDNQPTAGVWGCLALRSLLIQPFCDSMII